MPILAFADSAKALVANASGDIRRVRTLWLASMVITAGMMIVWVALAPMFSTFAGLVSDDTETVQVGGNGVRDIVSSPTWMFSFNAVTDSVFYGLGLTKYLAYQSVLTNGTVYLGAFLLYVSGAWEPTFEGVMALFALGILIDSLLTLFFLVKALYVDPGRLEGAGEAGLPAEGGLAAGRAHFADAVGEFLADEDAAVQDGYGCWGDEVVREHVEGGVLGSVGAEAD